jgi:hypothetical protein
LQVVNSSFVFHLCGYYKGESGLIYSLQVGGAILMIRFIILSILGIQVLYFLHRQDTLRLLLLSDSST